MSWSMVGPSSIRNLVWILLMVVFMTLLGLTIRSFCEESSTKAFDETLLANEPLQITDLRSALTRAAVAAERGQWSMALRLIRDARNQWELFVPVMQHAYTPYSWSGLDIERFTNLWSYAIEQAEFQNLGRTRRTMQHLESIMNRYRMPQVG